MNRRSPSLKRLLRDILRFLRLRRSKALPRWRDDPPPLQEAGVPARPLRPYSSGGAAVELDLTHDR